MISPKRIIPTTKKALVAFVLGLVIIGVAGYVLYRADLLGPLSPPKKVKKEPGAQVGPTPTGQPIKDFQPTDTLQVLPEGDGADKAPEPSRPAVGG